MIAELQTAISKVPDRKARLKNLNRAESVRLQVERAVLLFRGAPIAIAVSAINALIVVAVAWRSIEPQLLLSWVSAVLVVAFLRGAIWLRFRFTGTSGRNMSRFARYHLAFMGINGVLWGALTPIFVVGGLIGHALLPFLIAGMTAASIVSAGASWRAVTVFNLPALAPLATVYFMIGSPEGMAIATVVVLYGISTVYLAMATQRMVDRSILLHTKNNNLYAALQKQADNAHEAEQRFRALVEASHDLTLIFSPDGRITYASPSAKNAMGVEPNELRGQTTKDVVHPDDIPLFRAVGEKTLSKLGEVVLLSHVCMRGSKTNNYVAMSGRLTNMLYVPGVEGFVFSGTLLDAHEHERFHAA